MADATDELLRVSYQYLLITAVPGALAGLMFTYQQLLRGIGDTRASMRGGMIQLAVKVGAIAVGAQVSAACPSPGPHGHSPSPPRRSISASAHEKISVLSAQ